MKEISKQELKSEIKRIMEERDFNTQLLVLIFDKEADEESYSLFYLDDPENTYWIGRESDEEGAYGREFDVSEAENIGELRLTPLWHEIAGNYIGKFLKAWTIKKETPENPGILGWWF